MIERKVRAATIAAPVTVVVVYLLAQIPLFAGMPEPVKAAVGALITALATFGVSYNAHHTERPDLGYEPKHAVGEDGYSMPELALAVGVFIVLLAFAVYLFKGA